MARSHIFEEKEKDLRIEIPEGRIHGGNHGHIFEGTGGNRFSTLGDFHIEESGV
jgi:hypothetical protein